MRITATSFVRAPATSNRSEVSEAPMDGYHRLLKPQHFADAAYLREALNQQMVREKMAAQR